MRSSLLSLSRSRRLTGTALLTLLAVGAAGSATGATAVGQTPTPGTACGKGSLPERIQGRAPLSDVASGRYAKGYTCNATQVGHFGTRGGYRVERYVDKAGHECAFYDTTLLFAKDAPSQGIDGPGTYVMDMSDPAHPVHTDTLRTVAFDSPH